MSATKTSTAALIGLAVFAVAVYAAAERSVAPVHAEAYQKKMRAVAIMRSAEEVLVAEKTKRGIVIDEKNDPDRSGMVGPQFTLITTDRGDQEAKQLATYPNFAAAVTQMMLEAGVREGDAVAVGMTGSLPGFDLAVLSACKAIGAEPITVVSVGASMFGATDPEYTWLDMEATLRESKVLPFHTVAASLGGGGDQGRGLSPQGRDLLEQAIRRNGVRLLENATVLDAVHARVALYDSIAAAKGKRITCYINVGGGVASLGGQQNARLIPPGLTMRLARRNYPNRGVINVYGEHGVPIIQMLDVKRLARRYGILDKDGQSPKPGQGFVFVRYRYNLPLVCASAVILILANLFVLRIDLRQKMLGRPHPERAHS
jgi:poly-gamma-glutamate system protein